MRKKKIPCLSVNSDNVSIKGYELIRTFAQNLRMKQNRIYTIIIFCTTFILYAKTIGFDYSYFDDHEILLANQTYFESKDIHKLITTDAFLLEDNSSYYRPVQSLSFLADVVISGGLHAYMFHLTNIILFGMIGCFLFLMLLKLNFSNKVAFIGALLFCVHPLFVTAVAWIPARGDLLVTLLCLLSFIFFINLIQTGKKKHLFFVWLTFTIALFCKETAALIPLVMLTYFLTVHPIRKISKNHILLGIIMGLSGCIWLYLRIIFSTTLENHSFLNMVRTILVAFSQIIVFPVDFSPLPNFTTTKIIVGIIVSTGLIFLVCKKTKHLFRAHLFYILWFLFFLFPTFFAIQSDKIDYVDHRFLLPMIGILLIVLTLFSTPIKGEERMRLTWRRDSIWVGVVVMLWVISFFKTDVYHDAESFYYAVLKSNPKNSLAYYNRGWWKYHINGDINGALDDYNQAIFYNQEDFLTYNNRGLLKAQKEDINGALADFNNAILYNPTFSPAYLNRGNCWKAINNTKGALDDYNKAISIDNSNELAYLLRGLLYMKTGELQNALIDFDHAIRLNKNFIDAYVNRAEVKSKMGNFNDALFDANRVIAIDPYNIRAILNRAVLYLELGDFEKSLQDCNRVLTINPGNEQAIWIQNQILNNHDK